MTSLPIALVAGAFASASVAETLSYAELIARPRAVAPRGGLSAHAACALGAGIVGATLAARTDSIETIVVTGLVVMVLVATAFAGFFAEGVSAKLPLLALAIVIAAAAVHGAFEPVLAAAVTGGPFLITALLARDPGGRRGSLRDGAVAAIGGSVLGITFGIGATILGSTIGAIGFKSAAAHMASRSFAPYLACAIALTIVGFALFAP